MMMKLEDNKQKGGIMNWKSRKFWICVAAALASLGTGIAGIAVGNQAVAMIGMICTVASAAIYSFCEAWVDQASVSSNTTATTTTNTAVQTQTTVTKSED